MPKVDPFTALADLARRWSAFGEVTFPNKPRTGFEALTTPDALYAALAEVDRLRPLADAARRFTEACEADEAYIADKASDEGWVDTERAIRALWHLCETPAPTEP